MFEGIPKELPQTSHKAQDFFYIFVADQPNGFNKNNCFYMKKIKNEKNSVFSPLPRSSAPSLPT
ncbi:hypothetical protein [Klebsiella pneumoniae IS46]|nr:hypothetical protein [Klebsiella pneumoniae IS46]